MILTSDLNGQKLEVKAKPRKNDAKGIFDVVAESLTIKDAAGVLKVSEQDLYNFFYNIRKLYYRRLSWINRINGQRERSKLLKRVLTDRKHLQMKRLKIKEAEFQREAARLDRERAEDVA
jgi:hypothetical protein